MKKLKPRRSMVFQWFVVLGAAVALSQCGPISSETRLQEPHHLQEADTLMSTEKALRDIDQLVEQSKYREALTQVEPLLSALAETSRNDSSRAEVDRLWALALVKRTQLLVGLESAESAVASLRAAPWPASPRPRLVVSLFYAEALRNYLRTYSYDIAQRERIVSSDGEDQAAVSGSLDTWTREQIAEEATRVLNEVWSVRATFEDAQVEELLGFVEASDYPERIRGTLRDFVTYLLVDFLGDTSLWSPRDHNEIHRIPLEQLLHGPEPFDQELSGLHPLVATVSVLGDLEHWHLERREGLLRQRREEAAFEARLERLRRLRSSRTRPEELERLREQLRQDLSTFDSELEWWAEGQSLLASWTLEAPHASALIEAREIALAGYEAHPETFAGVRCQQAIAYIEASWFTVEIKSVDALRQRSIRVLHRNVGRLHFWAYPFDYRDTFEQWGSSELPHLQQLAPSVVAGEPIAHWSVDLPPTRDYRQHATYVVPKMDPSGAFVIVASMSEVAPTEPPLTAVTFMAAEAVVDFTQAGRQVFASVVSAADGAVLENSKLLLYEGGNGRQPKQLVETRTLDKGQRYVEFELPERRNRGFYVVGQVDGEFTRAERLSPSFEGARAQAEAVLFIDRPAYRPGQEVLWKVVAIGPVPKGEVRDRVVGSELEISLVDTNGDVVASEKVTTNGFGSASGAFRIPTGRLLGRWSLRSSLGGSRGVLVEEYKRPTFEVVLEPRSEESRLNRSMRRVGKARYLYGAPLQDATVDWVVYRAPYFLPAWGRGLRGPVPRGGRFPIASGSESVDGEGQFELAFEASVDESLAADPLVTFRYEVEVDVTDSGGETRSAADSFLLSFVGVRAELEGRNGFFETEQAVRFTASRMSLDGDPLRGNGSWTLYELDQPQAPRMPSEVPYRSREVASVPRAGRYSAVGGPGGEAFQTAGDRTRPRWEPSLPLEALLERWLEGPTVASGTTTHSEDGAAQIDLGTLSSGAYRLLFETHDRYGGRHQVFREFVVVGGELTVPLALEAQERRLSVGSPLRLLVHSAFADQPIDLMVLRGGELLVSRRLQAGPQTSTLEIPVEDGWQGRLEVRARSVRDHQVLSDLLEVEVPWDSRKLKLSWESFQQELLPGSSQRFVVKAELPQGAPADLSQVELLAYLYDRSLEAFAEHRPPNLSDYLPQSGSRVSFASLLRERSADSYRGKRQQGVRSYRSGRLTFFDRIGLGRSGGGIQMMRAKGSTTRALGLVAESAPMQAVADDAPTVTEGLEDGSKDPAPRSNFQETAFWIPHLKLDEQGLAVLDFDVPDSLTQWRAWVHAMGPELLSGELSAETLSSKPLVVRQYVPRFVREGDAFEHTVLVRNLSPSAVEGNLSLRLGAADSDLDRTADFGLSGEAVQKHFVLDAGEEATFVFPLQVPDGLGETQWLAKATAAERRQDARTAQGASPASPLPSTDSELHTVVVLPRRLRLFQSQTAVLDQGQEQTLRFEDLVTESKAPTYETERMTLSVDTRLFDSVLAAMPYLFELPSESVSETLTRFLSASLLSGLFDRHPTLAARAAELARRQSRLESWPEDRALNRSMALVETPWLQESQGEAKSAVEARILDPVISRQQRDQSIAKLQEAQHSSGAFSWWPGGPPSAHQTLYVLEGLSRARAAGVKVPAAICDSAWRYIYRSVWKDPGLREKPWLVAYMAYVVSGYSGVGGPSGLPADSFSTDDLALLLETALKDRWKASLRVKSYLALALHRADRAEEARDLFASVMDSSQTTAEQGTFWAPEDRAWLWYRDTVENHAFALGTLLEIQPTDERIRGLVQWLFLNKKLTHWKSTRATAEAIYSLSQYLEGTGELGAEQKVTVRWHDETQVLRFDSASQGRQQMVLAEASALDPTPRAPAEIGVRASSAQRGEGLEEGEAPHGMAFATATWHFVTDELPEDGRGDLFHVERTLFRRALRDDQWTLVPLGEEMALEIGDELEVRLNIRASHEADYVHVMDPRPSGFEPVELVSGYGYQRGLGWYREVRDSGMNFFFDWIPAGEYTLRHRLRATAAGRFQVGPSTLQSMYAPEFVAYSAGKALAVSR